MGQSPKLVVRLFGGLGNQLFQYAAARRLSYVNGVPLYLDAISGFERDPYRRSFSLNHFNIETGLAAPSECYAGNTRRCIRYLLRKWDARKDLEHRKFIRENGHAFVPELLNLKIHNKVYLEGYWQCEKYFHDIQDVIRRELSLKTPVSKQVAVMSERICQCPEPIGLHIRCNYYLNKDEEQQRKRLDMPYYEEAVAQIVRQTRAPHFFLFSDDPKWMSENFIPMVLSGYDCTLVDDQVQGKDFEILFLMTCCRWFILSFSTLSWWGAWLSLHEDKRVFAPEPTRLGRLCNWSFGRTVPENWILL